MQRAFAVLVVAVLSLAGAQAQAPRSKTLIVLIPGAGGVHPDDFLVVTQEYYRAAGFDTEMTTSAGSAASLIAARKAAGGRVVLVGMSMGAVTAAQAIAQGARPDGVVFAAGGLLPPGTPNGNVRDAIGDPAKLPRTLVLHHRADACMFTSPAHVPEFVRWAKGKARAHWISGGDYDGERPCRPFTPHTFENRQEQAAQAIISFARSAR